HDTQLWKLEYGAYPYLKNIFDVELDRRISDLRRNLGYLVGPLRDNVPRRAHFLSTWWWLRKRVHTLTEFGRRGREPLASADAIVPPLSSSLPPCVPRYPNACDFAVKYGETWWLLSHA